MVAVAGFVLTETGEMGSDEEEFAYAILDADAEVFGLGWDRWVCRSGMVWRVTPCGYGGTKEIGLVEEYGDARLAAEAFRLVFGTVGLSIGYGE